MKKFIIVLRLLTGNYTPFLMPLLKKNILKILQEKTEFDESVFEDLRSSIKADYRRNFDVSFFNLGRSAIYASLKALNLKKGDKVLISAFSCSGVITPILKLKLIPVLYDIDKNFGPSLYSIKANFDKDVRAIIFTHQAGRYFSNATELKKWARQRDISLVEDYCQSQGLRSNKLIIEPIGDVAIFSTNGGKTIMSAGGGWTMTADEEIGRKLSLIQANLPEETLTEKKFKDYAKYYLSSKIVRGFIVFLKILVKQIEKSKSLNNIDWGELDFQVAKMSSIDAKIILQQLPQLAKYVSKQRENLDRWIKLFEKYNISEVKLIDLEVNTGLKAIVYTEGHDKNLLLQLSNHLYFNGVEYEGCYIPLHLRSEFRSVTRYKNLLTCENLYEQAFCVPTRPNLNLKDWKRFEKALSSFSFKKV